MGEGEEGGVEGRGEWERERRKRKTRVLETGIILRLPIDHYQICNKNIKRKGEGGKETDKEIQKMRK